MKCWNDTELPAAEDSRHLQHDGHAGGVIRRSRGDFRSFRKAVIMCPDDIDLLRLGIGARQRREHIVPRLPERSDLQFLDSSESRVQVFGGPQIARLADGPRTERFQIANRVTHGEPSMADISGSGFGSEWDWQTDRKNRAADKPAVKAAFIGSLSTAEKRSGVRSVVMRLVKW
jgi:hypothetical protein